MESAAAGRAREEKVEGVSTGPDAREALSELDSVLADIDEDISRRAPEPDSLIVESARFPTGFGIDIMQRARLQDWEERKTPVTPEIRHSYVCELLCRIHFLTFEDTREAFYWNPKTGLYEPAAALIEIRAQDFFAQHATTGLVKEISETIIRSTMRKRDETDNPKLIPFENGYYDLSTRRFCEFTPKVPFFTKHPVKYDPLALCPQINKFLFSVCEEQTEKTWVIGRMCAYTLYRQNSLQKAFILHGGGANGKSVLLKLLSTFLGLGNVVQMSIQDISEDKFAKGRLYLKNANIFADLNSRALKDTGIFKALTGDDYITCDRKYMAPFEFCNYAKLIFSCNQPPRFNDESEAIYRRLIPIPFTRKYAWAEQNPDLIKELTTPEELSGWANQLLADLHELLEKREFGIPNEHEPEKIKDFYTRLADSARYYCSERLELSAVSYAEKEEIWREYVQFCSKEKVPILSEKSFWRSLHFFFEGHTFQSRLGNDGERKLVIRGILMKKGASKSVQEEIISADH